MSTQNFDLLTETSADLTVDEYNFLSGLLADNGTPEGREAINNVLPNFKDEPLRQTRMLEERIRNYECQITTLEDATTEVGQAGIPSILEYLDHDIRETANRLIGLVDILYYGDEDSEEWMVAHDDKLRLTMKMYWLHVARSQIINKLAHS